MDLDQLRYVLKIAELGGFTRAAAAVHLSQPALSRSIARLERELGQPVFERQGRGVVLSDAGRIVVERAREILALVDDLKAAIVDDGRTGAVRLAAIPTIAPYFLPGFLQEFSREFPGATVTVQEETTEVLVKRLQNGEIDLAVMARPIEAQHLELEDLFEEELLLVMSADHPLRKRKRVDLSDLEPLPFVLLGEAHCLTGNITSFCEHRSVQPISVERTSQLASVQELVALNHGISLIPEMASRLDTSKRRHYRSLSGRQPTRQIVMVSNPYRFESRLLNGVKERLRGFSGRHQQKVRVR